jgi:hypothetical protein
MNDYSDAEWKAISAAPAAAAMAMTLFDLGHSTGDAEHASVIANVVAAELPSAPEIVKAVAERFNGGGASELPTPQEGNHVHTRDALIATVRIAVRAVEIKSPTEVEGFKAWLASVAAKVCHATSPGEGTQVSRYRQDTIERLAEILAAAGMASGTPRRKGSTCSRRAAPQPDWSRAS